MSDDVKVEPPPRRDPISDAALAKHAQRMRPLRIAYASVLAVVAVAVLTIVVIAYNRGEISHATLKTVKLAPDKVALQTPSATLSRAWRSTDTSAIGVPYYNGTVVTHDQHTVRGRNALTGEGYQTVWERT